MEDIKNPNQILNDENSELKNTQDIYGRLDIF